ncbi:MAG: hypothetical protein KGO22_18540 [Gammaproteobacteria bacterium]|nr:hypothetical protein [Gammaproteobacteria bacterium]
MTASEHILLESDLRQVPDLRDARKSHGRLELRSRLRRRVLQLEIIDYYYLSVRSRAGVRRLEFSLDLRFARAPQLSRHIAWRWMAASLVLFVAPALIVTAIHASAWWRREWLPLSLTVAAAWAGATFVCVYRTTETLSLVSTCGAARLLEFTGGPGTFRALRPFVAKLTAHIRLASAARRRTKAEHLRDEMREHQRLRELGVLSMSDYEASKARILGQHARGRR